MSDLIKIGLKVPGYAEQQSFYVEVTRARRARMVLITAVWLTFLYKHSDNYKISLRHMEIKNLIQYGLLTKF